MNLAFSSACLRSVISVVVPMISLTLPSLFRAKTLFRMRIQYQSPLLWRIRHSNVEVSSSRKRATWLR